ncbi:MAG: nucleotidyltransferase family protein [Betaproteobacteria bacterium]|nr:nucleotidyltransferase family protein [Betaproteobacteria bacterium]MDE1954097.1 nucleotidyltransferase family protein [Betaproteobacteria bacterium]MDE2151207.1 nucleotidyltransferase family protein [Betaproteobacteria bacterium]
MIQGIVLAAGRSRRFGTDKRRANLDGQPLLLRTVQRWLEARDEVLDQLLVVLREPDAQEQELAAQLRELGVPSTFCAESGLGMAHSLAWGVLQTPRADGWLIGLGDMPSLQPASIRAVAHALRPGGIVLPTHGGLRGHPVGFGRDFAQELLALRGDSGARSVLQAHRHALQWLELEDPGLLLDVDEPGHLALAARQKA